MGKLFLPVLCTFFLHTVVGAQNIGISTATPGGKLQINHRNTASSPALILHDSSAGSGSAIRFSKESAGNTFSIVSTNDGLAVNSSLDFRTTLFSGIFLRGDRKVGIDNITNPLASLHVGGGVKIADTLNVTNDLNLGGKLKINGNAGIIGQVLVSTGSATDPEWSNLTGIAGGNIGYGVWGDCATNGNISEYNPVADTAGVNGDYFGISVSVSGNFAFVGSYQDDVGANTDQGSVSVYQLNGSNWVFIQKIIDATGAAGDNFGISVAVSGNYAIVGANADDVGANANQGSASIYQWNGSSWVLMQKITDATGAVDDLFGNSVSISGNYAIVGAGFDDVGANLSQGSASTYQWNGSNWVLMQKITDATGAAGDRFGQSVSVSGDYAIIGAAFDDIQGVQDQGSASIYQWNGSSWTLMQKINEPAAAAAANDNFGFSVSIMDNYVIVGLRGDDVGANVDQGSAVIYKWNGSSWVLMQKITDPNGAGDDHFGHSVSISGNYVVVGTPSDQVQGGSGGGSVSIYYKLGQLWHRLQYVTDPAGAGGDQFGIAVSFDGITKRFLIGAIGVEALMGKAVFGKIN